MERMARPCMNCQDDLPVSKVLQLLQYSKEDSLSFLPAPAKPKSGDVYLFSPGDNEKAKDDWRCDQYRWHHYGRKRIQTQPVIVKTYYSFIGHNNQQEKSFKRFSYSIPSSNTNLTLVYYTGDDSIAKEVSNGRPYIHTCPSVLRELNHTEKCPSVVYKEKVSKSKFLPQYHSVLVPRNRKQVANMQALQRQKIRLSHDALYNLHELSYDISDFMHKIVTYPDLVVVCGLKSMLNEVNRLLQLKLPTCYQLLSYDTTFQLGDFYVSTLLFRNTLFEKSPVMPAMFLIHERKLKTTHSELMRIVASQLPCLVHGNTKIPMVTDDEKGFLQAIDQDLQNVHRFYCWNHVINAAKLWLRSHGAVSNEIPVYVSHLRNLFHQETREEYDVRLEKLKLDWSQSFVSYYMEEIHYKAIDHLCHWNLEEYNLYSPVSGITSNQSESFNSVLKRIQSWKEIPLDSAVLSLYHLQGYYWNEWQRGLSGLGDYVLCEELKSSMYIPSDEMCLIPVLVLDEILLKLRDNVNVAVEEVENGLEEQNTDSSLDRSSQMTRAKLLEETCSSSSSDSLDGSSQMIRAKFLVQNGCVSHDPRLGTFTVIGSTGKPNVVKNFPTEFCSCPSSSQCYHIMAVKMSLGIQIEKHKKVNLSQLRWNTRAKSQKKSGRKRPRPGDFDITPAPDSVRLSQKSADNLFDSKKPKLDGIQFEELSITQQQSGEQTLEDVVVMKCDSNSINGPNNRRGRCKQCKGCMAKDCGKCMYCIDMKKFGGPGRKKKACVMRMCISDEISSKTAQHSQSSKNLQLSLASEFLLQFGRHKCRIVGDGNCLFRCISYFVYGTQDYHSDIRSFLTDFMSLNPSEFTALCHPLSVSDHLCRMKQNFSWGTHAEIIAASIIFKKPVLVAVQKNDREYYWAKYGREQNEELVFPTSVPAMMTARDFSHFEICHENEHYDVILTADNIISCIPPFTEQSSSYVIL